MATKEELARFIGERVRLARVESGFGSQDELAGAANIARQSLGNIESGEVVPKADTIFAIAQATKKPIGWFFPGDGPSIEVRLEKKIDELLRRLPGAVDLSVANLPPGLAARQESSETIEADRKRAKRRADRDAKRDKEAVTNIVEPFELK